MFTAVILSFWLLSILQIQDDDMSNIEDLDVHTTQQRNKNNEFTFPVEGSSLERLSHPTAAASQEVLLSMITFTKIFNVDMENLGICSLNQ